MFKRNFADLSFTDDYIFCNVLIENPYLCKSIAELAIGRKIKEIKEMQTQKSIKETLDGKGVRFDVVFEDEENTIYDIEMQQTSQMDLAKRTRYYQSLVDLETLKKGEKYDSIKNTYIIFICQFDPFGKGLHKYTVKNTVFETPESEFKDGTEKIF